METENVCYYITGFEVLEAIILRIGDLRWPIYVLIIAIAEIDIGHQRINLSY